jgi:Na+-transporting NADH:ubiquinone oxidoreductase subunit NqrC
VKEQMDKRWGADFVKTRGYNSLTISAEEVSNIVWNYLLAPFFLLVVSMVCSTLLKGLSLYTAMLKRERDLKVFFTLLRVCKVLGKEESFETTVTMENIRALVEQLVDEIEQQRADQPCQRCQRSSADKADKADRAYNADSASFKRRERLVEALLLLRMCVY